MKKIIAIVLNIMFIACFAQAQEFQAPKSSRTYFTDTIITYTYRVDEQVYKVYKSRTNAYYIWKISKRTNKSYKYYLPKEIQERMGRIYKK